MLPEVRMARIIDAIGLHQARKLSCVEAAELLGMSERHVRRLRDAYEAHGAEGIVDRRRGRASGRRAPVDEVAWVLEEFRTRSFDFTAKHFPEAIQGRPMADGTPFVRSYTWTKSVLQQRGLYQVPVIRTYGPSLSGRWIRPASNPSNPNESPLQGLGIRGRQEISGSRRCPPTPSPVPIFTASGTTRSDQATVQIQRFIPDNL